MITGELYQPNSAEWIPCEIERFLTFGNRQMPNFNFALAARESAEIRYFDGQSHRWRDNLQRLPIVRYKACPKYFVPLHDLVNRAL